MHVAKHEHKPTKRCSPAGWSQLWNSRGSTGPCLHGVAVVSAADVDSALQQGVGLAHSREVLAEARLPQQAQHKLALYMTNLHTCDLSGQPSPCKESCTPVGNEPSSLMTSHVPGTATGSAALDARITWQCRSAIRPNSQRCLSKLWNTAMHIHVHDELTLADMDQQRLGGQAGRQWAGIPPCQPPAH